MYGKVKMDFNLFSRVFLTESDFMIDEEEQVRFILLKGCSYRVGLARDDSFNKTLITALINIQNNISKLNY